MSFDGVMWVQLPECFANYHLSIYRISTGELYKDWNDASIKTAVRLGEAKLMAVGGGHVWQKHASVVVLYR